MPCFVSCSTVFKHLPQIESKMSCVKKRLWSFLEVSLHLVCHEHINSCKSRTVLLGVLLLCSELFMALEHAWKSFTLLLS